MGPFSGRQNPGGAPGGGPLPAQGGNAGKFLTTDGSSASWGNPSGSLPAQSGNSGKFLKTDGGAASWGSPIPSVAFAALPAATAAGAGAFYYVTDIGAGGTLFVSTGAIWKPASGVCTLAASAVAQTATGTGSLVETALVTYTIPAGLLTANGQLEVRTLWTTTSSANTKTARVRLGGASGTAYLAAAITTNAAMQALTVVANRNSQSSQVGFPSGSNSGVGTQSVANTTSSANTGGAVDLVISGAVTALAEVITLESYSIKLIIA